VCFTFDLFSRWNWLSWWKLCLFENLLRCLRFSFRCVQLKWCNLLSMSNDVVAFWLLVRNNGNEVGRWWIWIGMGEMYSWNRLEHFILFYREIIRCRNLKSPINSGANHQMFFFLIIHKVLDLNLGASFFGIVWSFILKPIRKECQLPFKDACHYDFFYPITPSKKI
jgi:hypothetical protein